MKKTLLILSTCIYFTAQSQFQKGVTMIGGSGNYYKNTRESDNYENQSTSNDASTFRITPGYFLADHHAVGIVVQFQSSNYNSSADYGTETRINGNSNESIGGGLFYRYFVPLKSSRLLFFIHGEGLYLSSKNEGYDSHVTPNTSSTGVGFAAGIRPGLVYGINKKIAMEFSLGNFGYTTVNYKNERGTEKWEGSDSYLTAGFSLTSLLIGISFYFGAKDEPGK